MSKINFFFTYDDFRCGFFRSINRDLTFFLQYADEPFSSFESACITHCHDFSFRYLLDRVNPYLQVVRTEPGFLPLSDAYVCPDFEDPSCWLIHAPTCFGYNNASGKMSKSGRFHSVLRFRPYPVNRPNF